MMFWSTLLLAFREMRRNVMRSFLTVLGIVIGVSAVITMVTIGNGATRAIADQIASLGTNLLIVRPGQGGPGREAGSAPRFRLEDAEAVATEVSGVRAVAPTVNQAAAVVSGAKNWSTSITGTTSDYFSIGNWSLSSGRFFTEAEERSGAAAAVIGETVRSKLFGAEDPVGASIRVKQLTVEVVGVLRAKGQGSMGADQDDVVVLPILAVQRRLAGNQNVGSLMIAARDGVSTAAVASRVRAVLRERRHITGAEADNFDVFDTKQMAETMSSTTKLMTTLLGAVAAVSLLVGGIGIMNIMLVSITERTREIGTRLAIGAFEREVLTQFLTESVALSSLGGLVGVALAAVASIGLSRLMEVPYAFDPQINVLAFGFSAAIGVLFGYVPAKRAARLDPIEALRHE
jgi:putative ABC transport system permease protein